MQHRAGLESAWPAPTGLSLSTCLPKPPNTLHAQTHPGAGKAPSTLSAVSHARATQQEGPLSRSHHIYTTEQALSRTGHRTGAAMYAPQIRVYRAHTAQEMLSHTQRS